MARMRNLSTIINDFAVIGPAGARFLAKIQRKPKKYEYQFLGIFDRFGLDFIVNNIMGGLLEVSVLLQMLLELIQLCFGPLKNSGKFGKK